MRGRVVKVARTARPGVHGIDELRSLLPSADIVVLVLPLTEETDRLFGAAELALLPDDALVVNVGRGRVLDTDALLTQQGRLRPPSMSPTPSHCPPTIHCGAARRHDHAPRCRRLRGVLSAARRFVVEQLERFATGQELVNVVSGG